MPSVEESCHHGHCHAHGDHLEGFPTAIPTAVASVKIMEFVFKGHHSLHNARCEARDDFLG